MNFKLLSEREGPDLKIFKAVIKWYRKITTGEETKIIVLDSPDSANVIAVTEDNYVVFVEQYRFGIQEETVELPGGFVERGEDPETAIKRELKEETGYICKEWKYLGKFPSNPVFQNSYIHHFLAAGATKEFEPNPDPAESIQLRLIHLEEIPAKLNAGFFCHPHTISAFSLGQQKI